MSSISNECPEGVVFDWYFLAIVSGLTILGVFVGSSVNKKMSVFSLRRGFAYFVVVMGLFIIVKELV